jgi:NAD(P)-dependent dehydrogenase (short-subunit alcohol dehydrogenase family)
MAGIFNGAAAVVTGAGAGIGRAVATHLAAQGASVVVSDITGDAAAGVVEEIRAAGGIAEGIVCDVADEHSVDELFARTLERFGGVHLAVNNAGIGHAPGELHELPVEVWDAVMAVDLRGTFLCLRAELAIMTRAGGGSIVNMASNAGVKNAPGMAAYTAAKHGVVGLTKNAALQYARRNIRVNAVCPGTILTPGMASFPAEAQKEWAEMIPMGRLGTPEEVAAAVGYLLSPQAAFVNGTELLIDGGLLYA